MILLEGGVKREEGAEKVERGVGTRREEKKKAKKNNNNEDTKNSAENEDGKIEGTKRVEIIKKNGEARKKTNVIKR